LVIFNRFHILSSTFVLTVGNSIRFGKSAADHRAWNLMTFADDILQVVDCIHPQSKSPYAIVLNQQICREKRSDIANRAVLSCASDRSIEMHPNPSVTSPNAYPRHPCERLVGHVPMATDCSRHDWDLPLAVEATTTATPD